MPYKLALMTIILTTFIAAGFIFQNAYAPTKIVPTDGAKPGKPFTIIDTPEGRLVEGSVAIFKHSTETVVTLRTHSPYKTAEGTLPPDIAPGIYDVSVHQPSGMKFAVGIFTVIEP